MIMELSGKSKSVLCAIPNTGLMRVELANILIKMSHDKRYSFTVYYPNQQPIDNNRGCIVKHFLESKHDYLLMIDNDNPPIKNPLDLVELDKDVIACPTPQWNSTDPKFPIYWVAMDKVEDGYKEHKEKKDLQEVDAVGTGCILIARRVLEELEAPFMRKWSEDGVAEVGLDFRFCEKAKEKGFKIYTHYDYPCSHYKELNLLDILEFYNG